MLGSAIPAALTLSDIDPETLDRLANSARAAHLATVFPAATVSACDLARLPKAVVLGQRGPSTQPKPCCGNGD